MERLVSTTVLAFAVAGFAQAPVRDSRPLESEPTGIISGRVVAADTGEVIRKARVTINGSGPVAPTGSIGPSGPVPPPRADTIPPVFTDTDGRFVVLNVPIGRVTLSAKKAGYVTTTFGARRPGMPPIALDVKDGVRGCAAIAFAVDADKWGDDSRFLATARSARDGAFDIRGLPAGDYFVTVADRVREDDEWHDPDVLNALARSAKRVTLVEGQTVEINFQLSSLNSQGSGGCGR